jgi:hypothetical protein
MRCECIYKRHRERIAQVVGGGWVLCETGDGRREAHDERQQATVEHNPRQHVLLLVIGACVQRKVDAFHPRSVNRVPMYLTASDFD